jgi:hypothetical protein
MARNDDVTLTARQWTQITNDDAPAITFQNKGGYHALVKATVDTTAPTDFSGAIRYNPGQGEKNALLDDLFPGLAAPVRLWAWSDEAITVFVSHA